MSENAPEASDVRDRTPVIIRIAVLLFVIVVVVGCVPLWKFDSPTDAQTFGDAFGFMNAICSALAFACVIVTLCLQYDELRLQRKEMRESQRLSASAVALSALTALQKSVNERIEKSDGELENTLARFARNRVEISILQHLEKTADLIPEIPMQKGSAEWCAIELLKLRKTLTGWPTGEDRRECDIVRDKIDHCMKWYIEIEKGIPKRFFGDLACLKAMFPVLQQRKASFMSDEFLTEGNRSQIRLS